MEEVLVVIRVLKKVLIKHIFTPTDAYTSQKQTMQYHVEIFPSVGEIFPAIFDVISDVTSTVYSYLNTSVIGSV